MSAFSNAIDSLRQLNANERRMILVQLAKIVQSDLRDKDDYIRLVDENESLVGVVFPFKTGSLTPPVLTPEEQEEDRRALENPGVCLTTAELIARIRSGSLVEAGES